jgi:transcriptional regulator with XRE-family HTH domain
VDVALVIRQRLANLGLEQKGLARAARVTESYVSQLLARKRAPPAPARSDIYDKMERFLRLPVGELARLADAQRKEELQRTIAGPPAPLLGGVRQLLLRKCRPERAPHVRALFEKEPFGELERLVTQKLVDVVKQVAKDEVENDAWLRTVAQLSGQSKAGMRAMVLEFLKTDILQISAQQCASFLDPVIKSWDIDLTTFNLEIALHPRIAAAPVRRFGFIEQDAGHPDEEPGLRDFLADASLSGTATAAERAFLTRLRFKDRRPTPLYYYRELQNLRDPLHFRPA